MGSKPVPSTKKTDDRTGCEVIRDAYLNQAPGSTVTVPQLELGATEVTVGHGGWFSPKFPRTEQED